MLDIHLYNRVTNFQRPCMLDVHMYNRVTSHGRGFQYYRDHHQRCIHLTRTSDSRHCRCSYSLEVHLAPERSSPTDTCIHLVFAPPQASATCCRTRHVSARLARLVPHSTRRQATYTCTTVQQAFRDWVMLYVHLYNSETSVQSVSDARYTSVQ